MLKKLKSKLFKIFVVLLALLSLGHVAFLFIPDQAKAASGPQLFWLNGINLQVDSKINGTLDNYAKIGLDAASKPVMVTGTITLKQSQVCPIADTFCEQTEAIAADHIDFSQDEIILSRGNLSTNKRRLKGVKLGLISEKDSQTKCQEDSTWSWFSKSATFMNCAFGANLSQESPPNQNVSVGASALNVQFTLDKAKFSDLGIDPSTPNTYKIYLYPGLVYDSNSARGSDAVIFPKGGLAITVQTFATQTAADSAPRPANVPGYGSTNSNAQATAGGGNSLFGLISKIIGFLLGLVQELIFAIFYWLVAPLIQAMLSIRTYTDTFAGVIYPGWEVVRNISNIIFIVALIAIGVATVLRVESYQYKHLLVQLILAALLVNFSLVIAQAILGVADTVQNQFLPNNVEVIRGLARDLMVGYRSVVYNLDFTTNGDFAGIIQPVFFLVLATGSFMVFVAIAAFLVIRICMLWVLMLVSPMAYVVGVLPSTAHYRSEWWSNFLKYAFFTPIMAFFLNMAAVIANTQKENPVLKTITREDFAGSLGGVSEFVFKVCSNLLLLVFLVIALKVADSFGIYGASMVSDFAKKGMFAPIAAFKAGGGALARTYTKAVTKKLEAAEKAGKTTQANLWRAAHFLNPKIAQEAYHHRVHEKEEEAYEPAIGYTTDSINRVIPSEWSNWKNLMKGKPVTLGQKTFYGRLAQASLIGKKRSLWEKVPLSEEEKVKTFLDVHHPEDVEALTYVIQDGRHEDGVMIEYMTQNRAKYVEKLAKSYEAKGIDKDGNAITTPEQAMAAAERDFIPYYDSSEFVEILVDKYKHAGLSDEQIGERLSHLQESAEGETKERGLGYSVFDDFDKTFRAANDLSGYRKMDAITKDLQTQGKTKEAADMRQQFLSSLAGTKKFRVDKDAAGNITKLNFTVKDEEGNDTSESYDITNMAQLDEAMKATKKYANVYDHGRAADLEYEIVGGRKNQDAQKRKERGNSERWSGAIEPAADMIQFAGGKHAFDLYTSYGRESVAMRPSAVITSLARTRAIQARAVKRLGLYKDAEGNYNLNPEEPNANTNYKAMAQLFELNPQEASTLLSRAGLTIPQLEQIKSVLDRPEYKKYLHKVKIAAVEAGSGDRGSTLRVEAVSAGPTGVPSGGA